MSKDSYDDAKDDWENVQEIVPQFKDGAEDPDDVPIAQTELVTIDRIIDDFRNQDLSEQLSQVNVRQLRH